AQLTGKAVRADDLYYMLSYDDAAKVEAVVVDMQELVDSGVAAVEAFRTRLVERLGLKPIEPFDARQELENRRKVMWSV
ncbi:MAG: hypothetical protein ABIA77_00010, partial [Candidatus Omnitrophota bacterium]